MARPVRNYVLKKGAFSLAKLLLILLSAVFFALPAQADPAAKTDPAAQTVSTNLYSVEMPDSWSLMEQTEPAGLNIIVFTSKAHDSVVTIVQGAAGDSDLNTIAESFAEQYKAHEKPVYKDGVASFNCSTYEGDAGSARIMVQDNQFVVATISGELRKGRLFLSRFTSEKFDALFASDDIFRQKRGSK